MRLTEEQKKLIEDNHGLIYSYIHNHNLNVNEWYGFFAESFCISAMRFDKNKGVSLSTYVYGLFDKKLAQFYRDKYTKKRIIPDDKLLYGDFEYDNGKNKTTFFDTIEDKHCVETEVLNRSEIMRYAASLKERDRTIFFMMCGGYQQQAIAEKTGVTQSYISRIQKK